MSPRNSVALIALTLFSIPAGAAETASIAARVSSALSRTEMLPRELLADQIKVWHIPAVPNDPEIVPKKDFGMGDRVALQRAMKDFRMTVVSTTVTEQAFTVLLALQGTRGNGEKYSSGVSLRFTVADELIVGMEATQDPQERAMLTEIAREGGFDSAPPD